MLYLPILYKYITNFLNHCIHIKLSPTTRGTLTNSIPKASAHCLHDSTQLSTLTTCAEGFLYGKISVLCALTSTLKSPRSRTLFWYSGIFAIYLQFPLKESRTVGPGWQSSFSMFSVSSTLHLLLPLLMLLS